MKNLMFVSVLVASLVREWLDGEGWSIRRGFHPNKGYHVVLHLKARWGI